MHSKLILSGLMIYFLEAQTKLCFYFGKIQTWGELTFAVRSLSHTFFLCLIVLKMGLFFFSFNWFRWHLNGSFLWAALVLQPLCQYDSSTHHSSVSFSWNGDWKVCVCVVVDQLVLWHDYLTTPPQPTTRNACLQWHKLTCSQQSKALSDNLQWPAVCYITIRHPATIQQRWPCFAKLVY